MGWSGGVLPGGLRDRSNDTDPQAPPHRPLLHRRPPPPASATLFPQPPTHLRHVVDRKKRTLLCPPADPQAHPAADVDFPAWSIAPAPRRPLTPAPAPLNQLHRSRFFLYYQLHSRQMIGRGTSLA
ncbi:hypothetical protein EX30DRAFT_351033 [Ascodesmis nigricans]|uniref:Uncharacterized protein n=1 Tax=Ascodesmis nigricans TaxID=341454 RepID=A0A4S2MS64_9PEZI|nr:hypothetical protein EX30DRAFT_351033 [Ascodesmis nigricans]